MAIHARSDAQFSRRPSRCRRGIALREVLVISFFGVVLLMLLVVWIGSRRGASRREICMFRQQQMAMAVLQAEAVAGYFPGYANVQAVVSDERQPTGWVFPTLPYIFDMDAVLQTRMNQGDVDYRDIAEDSELVRPFRWIYEEYGPDAPMTSAGQVPQEDILLLICPADDSGDRTTEVNKLSWVVNAGMADASEFGALPADWSPNGLFQNLFDEGAADDPLVSAEYLALHDGQENTLLMSENVDAGRWTNREEPLVGFIWAADLAGGEPTPGDLLRINEQRGLGDGSIQFARPSSFHVGGVNAVYASGSAQFLSEEVDWLVFTQLMSSWGEEAKIPGTEELVPKVYR